MRIGPGWRGERAVALPPGLAAFAGAALVALIGIALAPLLSAVIVFGVRLDDLVLAVVVPIVVAALVVRFADRQDAIDFQNRGR